MPFFGRGRGGKKKRVIPSSAGKKEERDEESVSSGGRCGEGRVLLYSGMSYVAGTFAYIYRERSYQRTGCSCGLPITNVPNFFMPKNSSQTIGFDIGFDCLSLDTRGSRVGVVVGVDYDCVCPSLYSRLHFRTAHARLHRANNSRDLDLQRANYVGVNSEIEFDQTRSGGCPMWAGWVGTLRL